MILFLLTGTFTYFQLPKREIPEISVNVASVSAVYPGATPSEVERTVTNPFENALNDMDGIDSTESVSTTGFSNITITLGDDANTQDVYSKIRQAVSDVSRTLPDTVQDPMVRTDFRMSAVASYSIVGENYESLYGLQENMEKWKDSLTSISGIKSVQVKGLPKEKLQIELNVDELNSVNTSPFQVIQTIKEELKPGAIGTTTENGQIYQLQLKKMNDWQELKSLSVGLDQQGDPIYLNDIGTISLAYSDQEDLITYKDKPAISLTIFANEGKNISSLQTEITDKINSLSKELPTSVNVEQFYTQSTIIEEVFSNLLSSFGISLLAVFIIMLLGLPVSSAILVALAVPISVLIGLIPLPYAGVDLNQISIIGIIIAIGILVDDAIVVNDNIQRRFQLGDNAWNGTIKGVKEVRLSIFTSTLMIIFSFFPLTFLSGSNGAFIRALPTTLISTILASTIIALTLIPTVQYVRKKRKNNKKSVKQAGLLGPLFQRLEKVYAEKILPKVTKRPFLFGISGLVACLLLASLAVKIPFEFFPAADRSEVTISVTYPKGTTLENTKDQMKEIETYLQDNSSNITETAVFAGTGMPPLFSNPLSQTGENTGQILVRVDKSSTSAATFIDEWEDPLRDKFPNSDIFLETIVSGPPTSAPIAVNIQGPELDQLLATANELKQKLQELDATELVTVNMDSKQPFIQYELDRELIAKENIALDQISSQLQIANTGIPLGSFDNGVEKYQMNVTLNDGNEEGVNLEKLKVTVPSQTGPPKTFSLDQIISSNESTQIGTIPHINGNRTITLKGYGNDSASNFQQEANKVIQEFEETLPTGYTFTNSGGLNAQQEFFIEVSKLFVIVLFLIYLVMAIQFNSLTIPLLITSTVFLAVTGAIIGLFVTNEPLSFLAVLGIVSLSGIVVRNSVILVDFIEQHHKVSESISVAIIEAGRARIRPILLTSLTSIAALLPIAFSGDVLFKPLAISIVAGLFFSTALTLILLPAFYLMLYKLLNRKERV